MQRTSWKDKKFTRDHKYLLDRNENCDAEFVKFMEAFLFELDGSTLVRYPNINKAYESLPSLGFDPSQILLTNGAEGAIRSIIEHHKDLYSISFPDPTYKMIPVFADIYRMMAMPTRYTEEFKLNKSDLTRGDIVYLANPDNPTGSILSLGEISGICESNKVVIIDEAYYGFSPLSATGLIRVYPNLYVVRSFSKAYGAAGIRLGMVMSNESNINKLVEYKPAYEISALGCEYLAFISSYGEQIGKSLHQIMEGKHIIEKELSKRGYKCRKTFTNFVLVEFDTNLYDLLIEVAAVEVVTIAERRFIRITAPDEATAKELVECLPQY